MCIADLADHLLIGLFSLSFFFLVFFLFLFLFFFLSFLHKPIMQGLFF